MTSEEIKAMARAETEKALKAVAKNAKNMYKTDLEKMIASGKARTNESVTPGKTIRVSFVYGDGSTGTESITVDKG